MSESAKHTEAETQSSGAYPASGEPARDKRRTALGILAALLLIALLAAVIWFFRYQSEKARTASEPDFEAFPPASVELAVENAPEGLKLGVVVSYTEDLTQGPGWDLSGEGVRVAQWRLAQGGTPVELVTVSDQGSDDGARAAIAELSDNDVSGVIALTTGSHTLALANAAADAGLPIIFPYQLQPSANVPEGAHYQLPTAGGWITGLTNQLGDLQCSTVVSVGGELANGVRGVRGVDAHIGLAEPATVSVQVLEATLGRPNPCVVIDAPASMIAQQVTGLRGARYDGPILVGPEAFNGVLSTALTDARTPIAGIYSYGFPTPGGVSLTSPDASGLPAGGFLQAVEVMRTNGALPSLRDDTEFSERWQYADGLSHDAVLSFVAAAAVADSTDPAKIMQALTTPEAREAAVSGAERVARCGAGSTGSTGGGAASGSSGGSGAGSAGDGPCPVQAAIVDGRIEWISSEGAH
ncbi:ABC transporter substrate-binding protein [Actinotignum sp. GS-2025b]|uniref:ABC transporter substrate-binding protein n=1 Tax=Actinotignum sp. GS-2025b TaxID=3427275 RepID=UPI003F452A1A